MTEAESSISAVEARILGQRRKRGGECGVFGCDIQKKFVLEGLKLNSTSVLESNHVVWKRWMSELVVISWQLCWTGNCIECFHEACSSSAVYNGPVHRWSQDRFGRDLMMGPRFGLVNTEVAASPICFSRGHCNIHPWMSPTLHFTDRTLTC